MKDNPNLRAAIYGGAFVALLVLVGWGRISQSDVPYWVSVLNMVVAGAPLVALANIPKSAKPEQPESEPVLPDTPAGDKGA